MATTRVEQIIYHEAEADMHQAKSDEHRWESARLISEELATGKSQRELASEIGKSRNHVVLMAKCWEWTLKCPPDERPPFNLVYNSPGTRGVPLPPGDNPANMTPAEISKRMIESANNRPDAEKLWDHFRHANNALLGARRLLQNGVTVAPIARQSVEIYLLLTAEINQILEDDGPSKS